MHLRSTGRGSRLAAVTAALGLLGLPLLTSPAEAAGTRAQQKPPAVKVMTRNVYLGADIMRPIKAVQSVDPADPDCPAPGICYQLKLLNTFAHANEATRDVVDDTDFATRVELLADEIASHKPDLVGLQEVAMWRSGPMDDPLGDKFLQANATTVDLDFLDMLLDALADRGVAYKKLSVNTLSDVEGPAFDGDYGTPMQQESARDVRLTMRDVVLHRKGSAVTYVKDSAKERTYTTNMPAIMVAGRAIEFERGYQWVDMKAGDRRFRFVNTHLEAFSSDVAYAQAQQLIDGPGAYRGRTIVVCDCNSDPANGTVKAAQGDTKRHWAPYFLIKREGGFADTWLQWAPPEEGFTSGLSETVDDETAAGFDHRIDMVFARTADGGKLPVLAGDVTGDEVGDAVETEAGLLWPSDHAGVVMKLRLR